MLHPIIIILILITLFYGFYAFERWKKTQPTAVVQKATRSAAIYALVIIVALLAVTGRLHWLFALIGSAIAVLIPFVKRFFPLLIRFFPMLASFYRQKKAAKSTGVPEKNQQSIVATHYIRMTLDHDTGDMDGEVLTGKYQDARLSDLSQEQILQLLNESALDDPDTVPLLEAYLDRSYGSAWRSRQHAYENHESPSDNSNSSEMTPQEAYAILGLHADASQQEIIAAHRSLISKLHPDRGGSNYLAAKINQAKDFLTEE